MTELNRQEGSFVVDAAYLRGQAREALALFVAPFTGVVKAVKGDRPGPSTKMHRRAISKRYSSIRMKKHNHRRTKA